MLLMGDTIVADLGRYQTVWKKDFNLHKRLNCGIPGDRTQSDFWRAEDLSVPPSVKYVVVQCGRNNLDQDEPKVRVDVIINISKVFQEKVTTDVKIILTGFLP